MSNQEIAENIIELLKQLGTIHPGGSNNIYKLHLKPNVSISVAVPIYINTGEWFRKYSKTLLYVDQDLDCSILQSNSWKEFLFLEAISG